jgi:hypothetical protein
MLDHLSIQCADVPASAAFYEVVSPSANARWTGGHRIRRTAVPDFWIGPQTW